MKNMARSLLTLSLFAFSAIRSIAGDTSQIQIAIFANEGRTFVLVEKGVTDGLGAPYMNAYAIDVLNDKWLDGFPIRESMDEAQVREFEDHHPNDFARASSKMMQQVSTDTLSSPALKVLLDNPSETSERVSNSPWELSAAKHTARFTLNDYLPSSNKAWKLEITEKDFPAGENCYGFTEQMKGYRLVLVNEKTGRERELNNDARVPNSRGCPLGYTFANVYAHQESNGATALAVLLRVSKPGFEGPDRRLMVVTTRLPKP